jgi:hypothetical protein
MVYQKVLAALTLSLTPKISAPVSHRQAASKLLRWRVAPEPAAIIGDARACPRSKHALVHYVFNVQP